MLPEFLRYLSFPLLLAGGLLLPGWLLGRAIGTPAGPAGALVASAALLLNLVLILDATGARLDATGLGVGLGGLCAALAGIAEWRRRQAALPPATPRAPNGISTCLPLVPWLLVPAAIGLAAIAVRAALDPLSGYDTYFRWDFLARQMLRVGSLKFYPPSTPADFQLYGWCDGIAPLVSSLYAWTYLSLGRVAGGATAAAVIVQAAVLFWLVWDLAARRGGAMAGAAAWALLATSSAMAWGVALGQETGFTAVTLVAMFWCIDQHRDEPAARWLVWAGLAAGTGALAREYGLAFIALGAVALAWWRVPRRGWIEFAAAAALVALPWYLRNWVKTGHPLYCHEIGALFPTNPVVHDFNQAVDAANSIFRHPAVILPRLAWRAGITAGLPLALGLAAGALRWRDRGPWLLALLAVVALWLWSLGLTAGGLDYSLRVLTPAIALGAVLGGEWLARAVTARRGPLLAAGLTLVAVDAAARSLYLPLDLRPAWWRNRPLAWRQFGEQVERWRAHPNWRAIAGAADGRGILVFDAGLLANFASMDAHPTSLLSPAVRFLFETPADFEAARARLRTGGFRFIVLMRDNPYFDAQFARYPFFRALQATAPAGQTALYQVFDLFSPPASPSPIRAP